MGLDKSFGSVDREKELDLADIVQKKTGFRHNLPDQGKKES